MIKKHGSIYMIDMVGYALLSYMMWLIWLIGYSVHSWQECMNMKLKVLWQCYVILNEYDMIDKNEQTLYDLDER